MSSPVVTTEIGAPTHLPLATPPGVSLTYNLSDPTVTISPSGRRIVYVGASQGRRLYLQDLDRSEGAIALAGTEGASSPFFAGDGEQIGFIANGQLQRVILGGGAPVAMAEVGFFMGGAWSPDNETIYFTPSMGGVWSVTANGERQRVTEPDLDNSDWGTGGRTSCPAESD